MFNGRIKGDETGNLRFAGEEACSVFNLVLKLEDKEETVEKIEVIPRIESDHLPVVL